MKNNKEKSMEYVLTFEQFYNDENNVNEFFGKFKKKPHILQEEIDRLSEIMSELSTDFDDLYQATIDKAEKAQSIEDLIIIINYTANLINGSNHATKQDNIIADELEMFSNDLATLVMKK